MKRLSQKIIMVTGKGGVGKSLVSFAIARNLAKLGHSTLLAELGSESFCQKAFGWPLSEDGKHKVQEHLDYELWSGQGCLKEYAIHFLKLESLYKLFFENKISKALIEVAPALAELAVLGKATSGMRGVGPDLPYDYIVIDSFSTGYFLALMRAPFGMSQVVQFGPMYEQTQTMIKSVQSANNFQVVVVTLPELLPITETIEFVNTLKNEFKINPNVLVNKVLQVPSRVRATNKDEEIFLSRILKLRNKQQHLIGQITDKGLGQVSIPHYFEVSEDEIVQLMSEDLNGFKV